MARLGALACAGERGRSIRPRYSRMTNVQCKFSFQYKLHNPMGPRASIGAVRSVPQPWFGQVSKLAAVTGSGGSVLPSRGESVPTSVGVRRQDELPVYERLGDVRAKAVTNREDRRHLAGPWRTGRGVADPSPRRVGSTNVSANVASSLGSRTSAPCWSAAASPQICRKPGPAWSAQRP